MIDTSTDRDWGPDPNTLAVIARRCGCVVQLGRTLHDGSMAYELQCPSHEAKVRLLAALADYDSKHPEIMRLAEKLAASANGEPWAVAQTIHAFVRDGVRHTPEPREKFQPTGRTLALGIGDCDDTARAVMALLKAAGLRGGLLTLGKPPRHVSAAVQLGGGWRWLDASLAARAGEHPLAAAKRLGLKVRQDLTQLGAPEGEEQAFNVPNLITLTGFSLGVAWATGGADWMGLASVALDDVDGYVARTWGQATKFGSLLDWASDQMLTPLVWQRAGLPWILYPPVALAQIAARYHGIKPTGLVPSVRGAITVADIAWRYAKKQGWVRR